MLALEKISSLTSQFPLSSAGWSGSDLVPSGSHYALENEAIPKSISRVLNSASLREEYKKRKPDGPDVNESQPVQRKKRKLSTKEEPLHILPGESLTSFNRRVEDNMRPQIRLAVQSGLANARQQDIEEKEERRLRKESKGRKDDAEKGTETKGKKPTGATPSSEPASAMKTSNKKVENVPMTQTAPKGKTEFDTLSSRKPKRLNDIVDAPPDMLALLKKNKLLQKTAKGGEVFGKKDVVPPEQKRMMEVEREKAIRRYREMKEKRQDAQ